MTKKIFQSLAITALTAILVTFPAFANETGILRITTDPGKAKIYVDGKRKGSSPSQAGQSFAIKLPEGEYLIEAIRPINDIKEQYGQEAEVFVGADTIQSLHIELSERLTDAARAAHAALAGRYDDKNAGDTFKEFGNAPEMVVIPSGSFMMGSPSSEEKRSSDEGPQREVSISRFALSATEVTFDQWQACIDSGGCEDNTRPDDDGWGRGERPVINVSWDDAQSYIDWLNEQVGGVVYRLPSEAEWEYAARAGTTTPFWTGGTISTDQANYYGDYTYGNGRKGVYREKTVPVGSLNSPNPFGLHDMHGNVWEWTEDCWHGGYSGAPRNGLAWLSSSGGDCDQRVLRGGSWDDDPRSLRSANRNRNETSNRDFNFGFRVARTLTR